MCSPSPTLLELTTDVSVRAAREVTIGESAGLNWDMRELSHVGLGRLPFSHSVVPLKGFPAFDDVYTFNPQQGSQWDGFRHWPSSVTGQFFEDLKRDDVLDTSSTRLGLAHWAVQGITGRGVLLDYVRWADARGIKYDAFGEHIVSVDDLNAVAKEQNVEFKRGDILLVRIGAIREWENMPTERKELYAKQGLPHAGIESSEKTVRWLWEHHFSAVASDALSFEVSIFGAFNVSLAHIYFQYFPFKSENWKLHDFLLAQWGTPIGEVGSLNLPSRTTPNRI